MASSPPGFKTQYDPHTARYSPMQFRSVFQVMGCEVLMRSRVMKETRSVRPVFLSERWQSVPELVSFGRCLAKKQESPSGSRMCRTVVYQGFQQSCKMRSGSSPSSARNPCSKEPCSTLHGPTVTGVSDSFRKVTVTSAQFSPFFTSRIQRTPFLKRNSSRASPPEAGAAGASSASSSRQSSSFKTTLPERFLNARRESPAFSKESFPPSSRHFRGRRYPFICGSFQLRMPCREVRPVSRGRSGPCPPSGTE